MSRMTKGLLAYNDLTALVEAGVIEGVRPGAINGTSIDVHLGPRFLVETWDPEVTVIDLAQRQTPAFSSVYTDSRGFELGPKQFVLAATEEKFNLPSNISAQFLLKSTIGRAGLDHAIATWCDPGWHNSVLTLELVNNLEHHTLLLKAGMPIGQMKFYRHEAVPDHMTYSVRGRYNNDASVQKGKL